MNPPLPDPEPHQCVLDKQLCLVLNASWQVIGARSVRDAIVCLASEVGGSHPAMALDMETATDENGDTVLVSAIPVSWEAWIELPIREGDLYIATAHDRKIRVPTVILTVNFSKMPLKKPRLCSRAIWERDNGTCQYTGKQLPKSQLNVDHVIPRDRGGKDEWTNMVLADRQLNSRKSNRLNEEVGLKLIREPKAPKALPVSASIKTANHPTWEPFLLK